MEMNDSSILAESMVKRLSSLAQTHRLGVFRALVRAGNRGLAAGEIASRLDIPASSLSFHLSHLREAGLVRDERQGRSIIYRANYDQMRSLLDYLLEECCADECATPDLAAQGILEGN